MQLVINSYGAYLKKEKAEKLKEAAVSLKEISSKLAVKSPCY